jgi:hypothetical protein
MEKTDHIDYMPKTGSERQTCGKLKKNPNGFFVRTGKPSGTAPPARL